MSTESNLLKTIVNEFEFGERINHLKNIKRGWCDGHGLPYCPYFVESVRNIVNTKKMPFPILHPMPDGGIELEWVGNNWSINLYYYHNRIGLFHAEQIEGEDYIMKQIDFRDFSQYNEFVNKVFELTRLERLGQDELQPDHPLS